MIGYLSCIKDKHDMIMFEGFCFEHCLLAPCTYHLQGDGDSFPEDGDDQAIAKLIHPLSARKI